MAFEEIKEMGMEGDRGLVAGRSQREKRRSYKDLLREEEEIAAQVRKSSKKRPKDSELFLLGGDPHRKKKKHTDDYYYRDHDGLGLPPHKKKHKSAERSPTLSSPSTDTAMGLLQAITSPLATGLDPSPNIHKKSSYPSFSSHSSKERKRDSHSGSASKSSHSSHSRSMSSSVSSKKHSSSSSSKLSLFHSGSYKEEPLTLREADGLKMKVIMSPEKEDGDNFPFPPHSSKGSVKKEKDRLSKPPKKKLQRSRDPLPVVGKEVEVEGHYGDESSSSGAELEAGELVIDDSYTHLSKKKKKSKKSKKKKDKEKDKDKEKSGKDKKHSKGHGDSSRTHSHPHPTVTHGTVGPMYAMGTPVPPHDHQGDGGVPEKKKKKEEKDRNKHEKDKDKPKKKNATAYQVFCKEYRVNINAEQPGLVFGELSKKLAEVWKAMPEKDKLVWRQKAQYLQHKQNKAEATTVKHKTSSETKSKGNTATTMVSPNRGPGTLSLSPARVPDVDPIDAAAHLQLLGESLSLIGHRLQETEGMVAVSGSLSVLLDSILCALGPLTCLTAQIPQLNGCPRNILSNTLDNIAYIMPGL
ncbi:HMG domain-containing protein 4a [Gouania willdenowi]|uniref:HMG box domain-containing protein n=1 Tax=Gouania willdenowi TaxID=441366 RepID=A0A8C5DSA6_GOUWI|nr:HMG domain-containing protein 4 [Gouania willdenowi]